MGAFQSQSRAKEFKQTLQKDFLQSIYPLPSAPVIKVKNRKPTKTALEWPNSAHGLLTINFKEKTCSGKGIMIGPNIVLTAGHNLYDHDTKTYADLKSMKFFSAAFGSVGVKKYFVSPNYIKEQKENYGILILSQSIGEATGYFGLNCLEPQEIEIKKVVIGNLQDKVDSERGQNGDIIWHQEGEDYYACGIYVSGTQIMNMANFLTRAIYENIHEWVHQASLMDFSCWQLKEIKELHLQRQEMNNECMHILMKYSFEDLTLLDLSYKRIGDKGVKILASNTSWINLSIVMLRGNNIGAKGAKELAKNTSWINLSHLYLERNNIGAEGTKDLAQNISWINLSGLQLSRNNIGSEGAKELAKNTSWINLSCLCLGRNNIGAEGAKELAKNTFWTNLSQLGLEDNNIGPEGAKELAKNTCWNLSTCDISRNNIGAEGTKELAKNTSWINLWWLSLEKNNVGAEATELLRQNKVWKKNREINTRD